MPGVFNLGGDLNLFAQHILSKDRDHLLRYAIACIDVLHNNAVNFDLPVTTISLVEGSALGGGFEAALSSNVLIAERSAEMGLPEILFNLFPGMGAYSLLARRIGMVEAEKMISSGKVYRADELYEMGVVDVLVEDGDGRNAVNKYIKQHKRSSNGLRAIQAVRKRYDPITYEELLDITKIWVDAALNLTKKDLRMMQRLVGAQDKRRSETLSANGSNHMIRTKQNRRILSEIQFPYSDSYGNVISYDRRKKTGRRLQASVDGMKQADLPRQQAG
jgi:DSF synthase